MACPWAAESMERIKRSVFVQRESCEQGIGSEDKAFGRDFHFPAKPARAQPFRKPRLQLIKFNHQTLRMMESKIWRQLNG